MDDLQKKVIDKKVEIYDLMQERKRVVQSFEKLNKLIADKERELNQNRHH